MAIFDLIEFQFQRGPISKSHVEIGANLRLKVALSSLFKHSYRPSLRITEKAASTSRGALRAIINTVKDCWATSLALFRFRNRSEVRRLVILKLSLNPSQYDFHRRIENSSVVARAIDEVQHRVILEG